MNRRFFIQQIGTGSLAVATYPALTLAAKTKNTIPIEKVRATTLSYIESMRLKDGQYGRFRYSTDVSEQTLYSSTYAAMTRDLYNNLSILSKTERDEWIEYLQSHQDDDGLYRDSRIFGEGWYKDDPEWCGRRHLTCHVLTALTSLGALAAKPLQMLEPFYNQTKLIAWLEERDWSKMDFTGNEVLNIGTLLQYERDYKKVPHAGSAMRLMLDWLSRNQMNQEKGLWGSINIKEPKGLSRTVMGAYHFWLLFFYDSVPIPHPTQAIDSVLRTQQKDGGFGCGVHGPASSACEDIDSIDPLARLLKSETSRRDDILGALHRAETHVLAMQNNDGGFVWVPGMEFSYGHPLMTSGKNASGMFPTWFRSLSLAYIGKAMPNSITGRYNWHFSNAPGIQFWF